MANSARASRDPKWGRKAVERVQTGVRIERRVLMVLKALAASKSMPVSELLEGILLHAFDGVAPFSADTLAKIVALKGVYNLDLKAGDSHLLVDRPVKPRISRVRE